LTSGNVVYHLLERKRSLDVCRVSMSLQIDADDLPGLGQRGQKLGEHPDTAQATVQEHQRFAITVDLII
jgi:hypothetical protein